MQNRVTFQSIGFARRIKWRLTAWRLRRPIAQNRGDSYAIGVTTYIARFDTYFTGLIRQLAALFPDKKIVVVANGHHNQEAQLAYLIRLRKFLRHYGNVQLVSYETPHGLTRMWNDILRATDAQNTLILNDDLYLMPAFRRELEASEIFKDGIVKINDSWSHFVISREILSRVGEFDETYPEIGYEDADYEARLSCHGIAVGSRRLAAVENCVDDPSSYSYGESIEVSDGKYSAKNRERFLQKWCTSDVEIPGSCYLPMMKTWVKLREKDATP